jgi:hypothetical protein
MPETLTNDVELVLLSFCDITTVLNYSYCAREKYELVHNSNWLWEQHTMAELKDSGIPHPTSQNWKEAFIEAYKYKFDLEFSPDSCAEKCFSVCGRKAARHHASVHPWERIVCKHIIQPHTITLVEFCVDKHQLMANGFRMAVGVIGKEAWPFDPKQDHHNIVGNKAGLSYIVGKGQTYSAGTVHKSFRLGPAHNGDVIGFEIDNGYTIKDKVDVSVFVNNREVAKLEEHYLNQLEVTEYRPAMSLCSGQEASIQKVTKIAG